MSAPVRSTNGGRRARHRGAAASEPPHPERDDRHAWPDGVRMRRPGRVDDAFRSSPQECIPT